MPPFSRLMLAAGLLTLGTGAFAQPPGPPPPNGPGAPGPMAGHGRTGAPPMRLPATRAELQTQMTQLFDRLDANNDGTLSPADRDARARQAGDRTFERLDTDKNGAISKAEFEAARGQGGPRRADKDETGRGNMPGRMALAMLGGTATGPIAKSDFIARGLARFDQVDSNHDGTISVAERDAAGGPKRAGQGRAPQPTPQAKTPRSGQ